MRTFSSQLPGSPIACSVVHLATSLASPSACFSHSEAISGKLIDGTPDPRVKPGRAFMAQRPVVTIDRTRLAELTAAEQKRLDDSTLGSKAMFDRANRV